MALFTAGADVYQFCSWELKDGKGVDDYIAGRVGTDPAKQCEVYHELFERAVPFIETLVDSDVKTVTGELHRTQDDRAQFELLRTKLAKHFKIPKDSFGHFRRGEKDGVAAAPRRSRLQPNRGTRRLTAKEVLDEICATIGRFGCDQAIPVPRGCALDRAHLPARRGRHPADFTHHVAGRKLRENNPTQVGFLPEQPPGSRRQYQLRGDLPHHQRHFTHHDVGRGGFVFGDNEEMRGVIDSGHEREFAWVIRTAAEGEDTVYFATWCPKALAMIGLPKRTILSRSIHVRLDRKPSGVTTEKLKKKHFAEFEDLRRKISRLANDIREQVRVFESDLLENRAGDNWESLAAIANAAGDDWVIATTKAAEQMKGKT